MKEQPQKSWFKRIWEKYNEFCKDFGVDQGCRSCVPRVQMDENGNLKKTLEERKNTEN
ncbi:DUF5363 domain-containing protein [Rodentibacter caecimuris]|uniref:DUF5363 domain-containing protein n=1 Tax=Rodentibacter caecimuris TaxID=1796644 RepID=UPI0015C35E85